MKKPINLNKLLLKPDTNYERFHEKTKLKEKPILPPENKWPKEWKKIYYKSYPRLPEIILPAPTHKSTLSFEDIVSKRSSKRTFGKNSVSLQKLSTLLFYSGGLRTHKTDTVQSRFYPSAGGRYPLEIYVLVQHAEIPQGLYHYYVKSHSLERLDHMLKNDIERLFSHTWIHTAPVIIIITALFNRMTVKYGDRGYRTTLLEAGHLAQNFYLQASAYNMHCSAIDGYLDDQLNILLGVDGINETVIHALGMGNE